MEAHVTLNSNHKRHLLSSAQYVDSLLSDIESILVSSLSKPPFPKYRLDITPAQAKLVQDYIARIRAQMVQILKSQGISPPGPQLGARHSIRVTLEFADIAFDECRPEAMRGYGAVPPSLIPELNGLVDEMRGILRKLNTYLAQDADQDLQSRLKRLERAGGGIELLNVLEGVVTSRGLVEFRPALSIILDKIESPTFQIAVFGRVSSGKSSLLNHILETAVLPVGVNPITAVPTRLVYGPEPKLTVSYVDRKTEPMGIGRLAEFVGEELNSANAKHVARIVVELPSPRLQAGVVVVDTPGLGSLATAGAAETLAYLPHCDLGIVLVDAGSTLTAGDIATIQSLYEAAIPALVLLSKADLLQHEDRQRSVKYISGQIKSQLEIELSVWPVSTQGEDARLLDEWFTCEIQPLFERHQELARQSLRRKIAALRDSVEATLKIRVEITGKDPRKSSKQAREAQAQLRRAAGKFEESNSFCLKASDEIRNMSEVAFARAALEIARLWFNPDGVKADERDAVARHLIVTASEGANQIFERLQGLARDLSHALSNAGRVLEAEDLPDEEELVSLVKEMPRLDPGPVEIRIQRDWLTIFGKNITKGRIGKKLRQQVGQKAGEAFQSYGRLLESWSRKMLAELHRHFDAHADGYRAQLERLAEGGKSGPEESETIRQDLAALAAFQDREQIPVASATT
ncbi:MAG TPA: dynamin family protein [Terriglobia bacterium]|nr:dynamin family protein [Terriglobia bacterium]